MNDVTARFLDPRHAVDSVAAWPVCGLAETPGADAYCRIFLALAADRRLAAAFAAFGPPPVIAAADWVCEWIDGSRVDEARNLDARAVEKALALPPAERYAGILAIDALANAMINLGN